MSEPDPMTEVHRFGGIDCTQGGQAPGGGGGDDFAMATWEATLGEFDPVYLRRLVRFTGPTAAASSGIIHREKQLWGHTLVGMDPGGGGIGVREELRHVEQTYNGRPLLGVTPLVTREDAGLAGIGMPNLFFVGPGDSLIKEVITEPMSGSSWLPNKLHSLFLGGLDNGRIVFPPLWEGWDKLNLVGRITGHGGKRGLGQEIEMAGYDPELMRRLLNDAVGMGDEERTRAEMDLAVLQLLQIDVAKDPDTKMRKQDRYGLFQFTSKEAKDSAYAMIYGYFTVWIWREYVKKSGWGRKPKGIVVDSEVV